MLAQMDDEVDTDAPNRRDWSGAPMRVPWRLKLLWSNAVAMAPDFTVQIQALAEARGVPESAVLAQALERGVEALWTDLTLSQYVNDEINRETAIERVGRERVRRVERDLETVEEDVQWGLNE